MGHAVRIIDYTNQSVVSRVTPQVWLSRLTKFVVGSTLILIYAGSLVTSTGSGLSVPDWPNTYGQFMFTFPIADWVGGIFYEHSHRLIASSVGLLTLIMAFWIGRVEKRKWVRVLAFCALAAVILQGVLGGVTVLFFLPTSVSVSHAVLAQTFFVLTIVISYSYSRERRLRNLEVTPFNCKSLSRTALVVSVLVYVQLILGALMRHTSSGLAIPDFPTMGGSLIPFFDQDMLSFINSWRFDADLAPISMGQVWIHFIHRIWAFVVVLGVSFLLIQAIRHLRNSKQLFDTVMIVCGIAVVQVVLGIITVLSQKQVYYTSFHVVTGAALLGFCVLLTLRSMPLRLCR